MINGGWELSSQGDYAIADVQIADAKYIFEDGAPPPEVNAEPWRIDLVYVGILQSGDADALFKS
jgi:hypothetical protein